MLAPLTAALLLAGSAGPARAESAKAASVRSAVDDVLRTLPRETQVGLVALELPSGTPWVMHGADTPLKPASVMKLFVTAAALERFGNGFAFETRFEVVDDELRVIGSGDPGLGDERLLARAGKTPADLFDAWAGRLRASGQAARIRKIVLDDAIFDRQWRHPDWPDDQYLRWYQAPVGGINFYDNCVQLRLRAGGGVVRVESVPELPASFLRNDVRAAAKHLPRVNREITSDIFSFSGTAARDHGFGDLAVQRPTVSFGFALQHALKQRGVPVEQVVRRPLVDPPAPGTPALAWTERTPLVDVLWRSNTFSQNLFAECLLKALAAYNPDGTRSGRPGSWEGGAAVLEQTLRRLGVDLSGAVFRDGSGLSHQNRVTARQIAHLLAAMQRHRHAATFQQSLAEPGDDGTMRSRYDDPSLRGHVHAKTGTIRGVRTLAGYIERPDGQTLSFALLLNGPAPRDVPVKVCRALLAGGE